MNFNKFFGHKFPEDISFHGVIQHLKVSKKIG